MILILYQRVRAIFLASIALGKEMNRKKREGNYWVMGS
jgi:hypothetical protein